MKAIVCIDKHWGIGKDGDLLAKNPIDMDFFKTVTSGHCVVMGRKTLESFKNKKPLPNRTNIVLSRTNLNRADIVQFYNIEDFLKSEYNSSDTFVIGGGSIYKELLDFCDEIYVTKMENEFDADTFFPNLDENKSFELVEDGDLLTFGDLQFKFIKYKKIS